MLHFQKVGAIHKRRYLWDAGQRWPVCSGMDKSPRVRPYGSAPDLLASGILGDPATGQPFRHGSQACSSPEHPSLLPADQWEPPWGFKEVVFSPRESAVKLGLAWNWIRHQETEKQQALGEGREEGGPTDPSGQTLTVPTLTLTDAGISARFYAGGFHTASSL